MTTQIKVTTREIGKPAKIEFDWPCDDDEMRTISFDCDLVRDEESGGIELTISNIGGDDDAAMEMVRMSRAMYAHEEMVNAAEKCRFHYEAAREGWDYLAEVLEDVAKEMIKSYRLNWQVEAVLFRVVEE